ncbi:TniQ family protein [Solimonas sp. SE-A11]|uniref:TniQ family protein n=1 Tax=Solimonas sp. SE-A11 TaxID=3054954 RepID=UPI003460CA7D
MSIGLLPRAVAGGNTEAIESLASYFHRVRLQNLGATGAWLARVSQPESPRSRGARNIRLLGNINTYDGAMVQWLHREGCPAEVLNLGFHRATWLTARSFRPGRAWCPECLLDEPRFERTAWSFREYSVCSRHQVRLEVACPECGWQARFPSSHVHKPGHCDQCGMFLGRRILESHQISQWEQFCAQSTASLVLAYQRQDQLPPPWPAKHRSKSYSAWGLILLWAWLIGRDPITGDEGKHRGLGTLPAGIPIDQVASLIAAGAPHLDNLLPEVKAVLQDHDHSKEAALRARKAEWRRKRLGLE